MAWFLAVVPLTGVNLTFWASVGLVRLVTGRLGRLGRRARGTLRPAPEREIAPPLDRLRQPASLASRGSGPAQRARRTATGALEAARPHFGAGAADANRDPAWWFAPRKEPARGAWAGGRRSVLRWLTTPARWLLGLLARPRRSAAPPGVRFRHQDHYATPWSASGEWWRGLSKSDLPLAIAPERVAAIIPAHNEELGIQGAIESLRASLPAENIYVGSDASTDRTIAVAEATGVNVVDIRPNRGKAGVLSYVIKRFDLVRRFDAILILDADSRLDRRYLELALPLFGDPEVVAIATHARSTWYRHRRPRWSMLFTAYRVRLYRILQAFLRYGQTWRHTNVHMIVPGFAGLYRTATLPHMDIDAPGLIIEDFNMTFEVRRRRLGKIAYVPQAIAWSQDPDNLRDYTNQVKRWHLGFWQTVRRHGVWPSLFWLTLGALVLEMLIASAALIVLVPLGVALAIAGVEPVTFALWGTPSLWELLLLVVLVDYALTAAVAVVERQPLLLVYGLVFFPLRYLDAVLFLYTLPLAFVQKKSDGRWTSPKRRALPSSE